MFQSLGGESDDLKVPKKKKVASLVLEPYRYSENVIFERLPFVKMECESEEVFSDRASTPLTLDSQSIHVDIVAGSAKVTTIMTFHNSTNKTLAGELVFPLPKDTSIHGYGLDINGVMVDAVPVPKEQARIAFETTVREHGPEISIAEQVDAMTNSFKTRVYPMQPNGKRTIKVVVLCKLIEDEQHQMFFWNIQKPASLKNFKFTMNSPHGTNTMCRRTSGAMESVDLTTLEATSDFEGVLLVIPKVDGSLPMVVTEKNEDEGYTYFSATLSNLDCKTKTIEGIKKATVFYDVSSSRRFSEWKEELKLLRQFMEKNSGVTIEFITFSNCIHERKTFTNFEELAKYATDDIKFDGGTCIPLKSISEVSTTSESQVIMLLSDGISNYGGDVEAELMKMRFGPPIYCVSTSPTSAYILLRYLGGKSGGGFFDVTEESIESVVEKIGVEQFGVRNLIYDPLKMTEVFSTPIVNKAVSVYGRILSNESGLEVDFGNGQVAKVQIDVGKTVLKDSTIIRTLWAQQKIQALSIFADRHRDEITKLGMEYGIVTENTSLIVLSDISQYQKYKVVPPKSLKDVRKRYLNEIDSQVKQEERRVRDKIENVVRKWESRIDWHKKEFKPAPEPIPEMKKKEEVCCEMPMAPMASSSDCLCDCFCSRACCCEGMMEEEEERAAPVVSFSRKKKKKKKKKMLISKGKKNKSSKMAPKKEKKKEKEKKANKPKAKPKPKPKPSTKASINVKAFVPGSAYLEAIQNSNDRFAEYLKQKTESFEESPSFYLDVADYFITVTKDVDFGVKVLSNIAELELNNIQLLRIVAYRLDQAEKYDESIEIFEKVLKIKPEEPQSYRDLALVIEKTGELERAAELLWKVITMKVDSRFDEIELTAAIELNHVLEAIKDENQREQVIKKLNIDRRFIYHMDCDIRVSMAWDTDSTDIDLHVYDPVGEHCFYSHKNTAAGGFISRDFVRGYGPEEFMQKKVWKDGKFRITAKYFASHQQSLTGGTTILCTFFTKYLKPDEQRALVTLRLTTNKSEVEVCEIDFKVSN